MLREQIRRLQSLTNKPFGVNVLLSGPHSPFPIEAVVEVCLEERVPILSIFWGDPTPYVARAHAARVKVIDQVGSVAEAQRAAQAGVDAIVAQGVEAGGHVAGEVTTIALVPRVVDSVAPIPVVAAGVIADARGLVVALALGAQVVMIGTRLIATPEAYAHPVYRQKVLARRRRPDRADHAVRLWLATRAASHIADTVCRTLAARRGAGSEQRPDEPHIGETKIGGQPVPLLRFMGFPPTPDAAGDLESMDFLAGQSVGLVKEIKPVAEVVREFIEGARHILSQLTTE